MANIITLIRLTLVFAIIGLIFTVSPKWQIINIPLLIFIVVLDGYDGIIARKYGRDNIFGAVFDIAADRITEITLWVTFAYLKLIPLWIPLLVITRGILVDSLRNQLINPNQSPFGLMHSKIGIFLVKGRFSRFSYSLFKLLTCIWLLLMISFPAITPNTWHLYHYRLDLITSILVYTTITICLIRGVPVIIDIALEQSLSNLKKT